MREELRVGRLEPRLDSAAITALDAHSQRVAEQLLVFVELRSGRPREEVHLLRRDVGLLLADGGQPLRAIAGAPPEAVLARVVALDAHVAYPARAIQLLERMMQAVQLIIPRFSLEVRHFRALSALFRLTLFA